MPAPLLRLDAANWASCWSWAAVLTAAPVPVPLPCAGKVVDVEDKGPEVEDGVAGGPEVWPPPLVLGG